MVEFLENIVFHLLLRQLLLPSVGGRGLYFLAAAFKITQSVENIQRSQFVLQNKAFIATVNYFDTKRGLFLISTFLFHFDTNLEHVFSDGSCNVMVTFANRYVIPCFIGVGVSLINVELFTWQLQEEIHHPEMATITSHQEATPTISIFCLYLNSSLW